MSRFLLFLFFIGVISVTTFGQTTAICISCEPVRTEAIFGKGQNDWEYYLKETINLDAPAGNCAPSGKYYVEVLFLIGRNGKIEEVRQRSKVGYGMEEELMRAIRLSTQWKPATQNGRMIREYRCGTFIFNISAEGNTYL